MVLEYDNWERLVKATLRREELRQLSLEHSRTPSATSTSSNISSNNDSPVRDLSSSNSNPPQPPGSSSQQRNLQGAADFKNAKLLKKRTPSRLRLDRWIWTRWRSK
ncbi:beta-1 [Abeliophyllum distichum]|uniref:Beta-1 n=1 Tax=Abeliophyllum distichum TaxID=126358 RepID=A0ABD1W122_9LAMI